MKRKDIIKWSAIAAATALVLGTGTIVIVRHHKKRPPVIGPPEAGGGAVGGGKLPAPIDPIVSARIRLCSKPQSLSAAENAMLIDAYYIPAWNRLYPNFPVQPDPLTLNDAVYRVARDVDNKNCVPWLQLDLSKTTSLTLARRAWEKKYGVTGQ